MTESDEQANQELGYLAFASMRTGAFANPYLKPNRQPSRLVGVQFVKWLLHQPDVVQLARLLYQSDLLDLDSPAADLVKKMSTGEWPPMPAWPVFVFGSNLAGRHGKGAALYARKLYSAQPGVGRGPTGHAYALPTKDEKLEPLPLGLVQDEIRSFYDYARSHTDTVFRLTRVGCGLSGLDEDSIRSVAQENTPSNVALPGAWSCLGAVPKRVIVTGPRAFSRPEFLAEALDCVRDRLGAIEIVSGGEEGVERLAEDYAINNDLHLRRIPAFRTVFGQEADAFRNRILAWYGTHLVAFDDDQEAGDCNNMLAAAVEAGLKIAKIRIR